jgi:hypothetical protein
MRYSHRVAGLKPATMTGAAMFMTGMMLAGGIGGAFASEPRAPVAAASSQPPAPGPAVTSATLTSVDIPTQQPPATGPKAVVIPDPGVGNNGPKAVVTSANGPGTAAGPKAIVIGDPGGDGPGPKAVVISGGDPALR